ncbi:MAG: hypothetical protein EBY23_08380 [Actinobacteria bacterium]|nr:hypothetical protein [Actinomycetota bacterium]
MRITRAILTAVISTCSLVAVSQPVHAAAEPTYVLDPNLTATDQTNAADIKAAITKAATEYGYTGFTAVIYAPTSAGATWAHSELAKISCPLGPVESMIAGTATADTFLGKCIVFKAVAISYANVSKDTESVAYHEIFHLAQAFRGGLKTMGARFDDMRWMYEGTAEVAGYQPQLTNKKRTQDELIALMRVDAMLTSSSLTQVSNAWIDNSIALVSDANRRTNAMYARSYLAAYYLTTISTKDKVMNDYFVEAGRSGDHVAAFSTTFGMTVSEYDAKFTAWLNAWTAPTTTTSSTTTAPRVAPTVSTKKAATLKSVAVFGKMTVPAGASVTAVVATSSKTICRVIGATVKGIKKGTCRVAITVKIKTGAKTTRTVAVSVAG